MDKPPASSQDGRSRIARRVKLVLLGVAALSIIVAAVALANTYLAPLPSVSPAEGGVRILVSDPQVAATMAVQATRNSDSCASKSAISIALQFISEAGAGNSTYVLLFRGDAMLQDPTFPKVDTMQSGELNISSGSGPPSTDYQLISGPILTPQAMPIVIQGCLNRPIETRSYNHIVESLPFFGDHETLSQYGDKSDAPATLTLRSKDGSILSFGNKWYRPRSLKVTVILLGDLGSSNFRIDTSSPR